MHAFAPGGLIDRLGWSVTRAFKVLGPVVVSLSLLGALLALVAGDWSLARALALNALFQALAFGWAIVVGTWAFGPRKDGDSP